MSKIKIGFLVILLGLCATFALSLFLTFAENLSLPGYASTGANILSFNAGFFRNGYEGIGMIASAVFVIYFIMYAGAAGTALSGMFAVKPANLQRSLNLLIAAVCIGFVMVILAIVSVVVSALMWTRVHYEYSTDYYFLLIPLAVTLAAIILTKINVRRMAAGQNNANQL